MQKWCFESLHLKLVLQQSGSNAVFAGLGEEKAGHQIMELRRWRHGIIRIPAEGLSSEDQQEKIPE